MSVGVMFFNDRVERAVVDRCAQRFEECGLDTIWVPEVFGREPFALSGHLLARTETIRVGTFIANVYARDAVATAAAARTLGELSGGRFTLGLGVSNARLAAARGHDWEPPVAKLRATLDAIATVELGSPEPPAPVPVLVAAHGPRMVKLASSAADGLCTWNMPVDHTAATRATIGSEPALHVAQFCVRSADPELARDLARRALSPYVRLDYYHRAWRRLGFDDGDFVDGGSDRLVDALVAWGDLDAIGSRVRGQLDAGATQVVVVPLGPSGGVEPDWELVEGVATSG